MRNAWKGVTFLSMRTRGVCDSSLQICVHSEQLRSSKNNRLQIGGCRKHRPCAYAQAPKLARVQAASIGSDNLQQGAAGNLQATTHIQVRQLPPSTCRGCPQHRVGDSEREMNCPKRQVEPLPPAGSAHAARQARHTSAACARVSAGTSARIRRKTECGSALKSMRCIPRPAPLDAEKRGCSAVRTASTSPATAATRRSSAAGSRRCCGSGGVAKVTRLWRAASAQDERAPRTQAPALICTPAARDQASRAHLQHVARCAARARFAQRRHRALRLRQARHQHCVRRLGHRHGPGARAGSAQRRHRDRERVR